MIENVKCPLCGGAMTSRKNRISGQRFWGCNGYPDCRGTLNTDGDTTRNNQVDTEEAQETLPSGRQHQNDRGRWRNQ